MALVFRTFAALAARAAVAATFAAAVTTRAAVTAATAATRAAVTAVAAVTARTTVAARFARRARVFQLFAGFLVDDAHRQANLAARVDLEDLDLDFLTFGQNVGDLLDALVGDFADVDETVLATDEIHERAEIDEVDDGAVIDGLPTSASSTIDPKST
jgi:multidrug efflux pump subunit AcrA (membrane-fusion protein)